MTMHASHSSVFAGRARPDEPAAGVQVLAVMAGEDHDLPAWLKTGPEPGRHDGVHVELRAAVSLADLEQCLAQRVPDLLVVDESWLRRFDADAVGSVQQRHPGPAWMLACRDNTPRSINLIIVSHSIGCVDWDLDRAHFVRAVTASLQGRFWFSRPVMQRMYQTLLQCSHARDDAEIDSADGLSERQLQVMSLMREGLSNKEIAARLSVSVNTVKKHLAQIFERLGLHRRRQLIQMPAGPSQRSGRVPDRAIARDP